MPDEHPTLRDALTAEVAEPRTDEEWAAFDVADRRRANWALRKLAEHQARIAALVAEAEDEQSRIRTWLADVTAGERRQAANLELALQAWAERQHQADPSVKSWALPAGRITSRPAGGGMTVLDPEAVVTWAVLHGLAGWLRCAPAPSVIAAAVVWRDAITVPCPQCEGSGVQLEHHDLGMVETLACPECGGLAAIQRPAGWFWPDTDGELHLVPGLGRRPPTRNFHIKPEA